MDEPSANPAEPPSPTADSFLERAFGFATDRYWALLEALFDGLYEYDVRKGGSDHAPAPLPAA